MAAPWQAPTFGNGCSVLSAVHLATLTRVVLERMPGLAVVHALEDGHRVGLGVTELQTNVGELVLFAQPQCDSHILTGVVEWLGHPAGEVVGIVQVGQVVGGVTLLVVGLVAYFTVANCVPLLIGGHETVTRRWIATFAGHLAGQRVRLMVTACREAPSR